MFPRVLRREVLILLALKAAALTLIFYLFFAPHERSGPPSLASHLLSRTTGESDHGHR